MLEKNNKKNTLKKVLIVGEVYSENLGDGVICKLVEKILKNNQLDIEINFFDLSARDDFKMPFQYNNFEKIILFFIRIIIFSLHLQANEGMIGLYNILFKKCYKKNKFKKKYDLIIFAGGQMFMDYFLFPISDVIKFANEKNIPVIFHACGVKNIENKIFLDKMRDILASNIIKSISTRDDVDLLNSCYLINSNLKAEKTFDIALWTRDYYRISMKKTDLIGLGIMDLKRLPEEKIIKFWLNMISFLNEKNIKWKMFCNGQNGDYNLAKRILSKVNMSGDMYLMFRPQEPEELVNIISSFKSIISFRLHSHIIATSLNIPTVGIKWEEKIYFFFKSMELENRCKEIDSLSEDVYQELLLAETEGYNQSILNFQKENSKKMLLNTTMKLLN